MKGAGFHLAGTDVGDTPGSSNLLSVLECKLRLFIYICLRILEKAMAPHSSTFAWKLPCVISVHSLSKSSYHI